MNPLEILLFGGLILLIPGTFFGLVILGKSLQKMGENIEEIQEQVNTDGN